jgi:hypothetical protein
LAFVAHQYSHVSASPAISRPRRGGTGVGAGGSKIKSPSVLCGDDNTSVINTFIFHKLLIRVPETAYFFGGFYRLLSPSMQGSRQRKSDPKWSDAYAQKRARKRTTRKVLYHVRNYP